MAEKSNKRHHNSIFGTLFGKTYFITPVWHDQHPETHSLDPWQTYHSDNDDTGYTCLLVYKDWCSVCASILHK